MFALPLFAARGALGGTRIMALLSLDCSGGRNGGRDGRERVGVALESWLWELWEFSKMLFLERLTDPSKAALMAPALCPLSLHVRAPTQHRTFLGTFLLSLY
jgi:hypothetical protein